MGLAEIENFLSEYIDQLDVKASSKYAYEHKIRYFLQWAISSDQPNLSKMVLVRYKEYLTQSGFKPTTANSYLSAISCYCSYLADCGRIPKSPKIRGFRMPKEHLKDPLTPMQIYILTHPKIIEGSHDEVIQRRDVAIFYLLCYTGIRLSSLCSANVSDLRNRGSDSYLDIFAKGGMDGQRNHSVLLVPSVVAAINAYWAVRGSIRESDPMFTSESNNSKGKRLTIQSVSSICKAHFKNDLGIVSPRYTAHSCRHSTAQISAETVGLLPTMRLMNHRSPESTIVYLNEVGKGKAERAVGEVLDGQTSGFMVGNDNERTLLER